MSRVKNKTLPKVLAIAAMLGSAGVMAAPPFADLQAQIADVATQVDTLSTQVDGVAAQVNTLAGTVNTLQGTVDSIASQVAAQNNTLQLQTSVDTEVCASVPVQCAAHSYVAASATNHNPIRLFVQVVKNGAAVNGLTLNNFVFSNPFVPAGGGAAVLCSEANCGVDRFQVSGHGLYSLWLDRVDDGNNWKAGAYAGTVHVVDGAAGGTAMLTFSIPD